MQENEISLKEFILVLSRRWKWIVGTTFTFLAISILILTLFNSTSYQVVLSGTITKADEYETKLGIFPAQDIKSIELINLVRDKEFLKLINQEDSPISINTTLLETGEFTIILNSTETILLNDLSTLIIEDFEDYVNFNLLTKASDYFMKVNLTTLNLSRVTLEDSTRLIDLLTLKLNSIDRLISPGIINPEYNEFSSYRASIEYETIRLKYAIEKNSLTQELLKEYKEMNFDEYQKDKDLLNGLNVSLQLSSSNDVQELHRFNSLSFITFSTIFGTMLSIFVVYFLHYWRKN